MSSSSDEEAPPAPVNPIAALELRFRNLRAIWSDEETIVSNWGMDLMSTLQSYDLLIGGSIHRSPEVVALIRHVRGTFVDSIGEGWQEEMLARLRLQRLEQARAAAVAAGIPSIPAPALGRSATAAPAASSSAAPGLTLRVPARRPDVYVDVPPRGSSGLSSARPSGQRSTAAPADKGKGRAVSSASAVRASTAASSSKRKRRSLGEKPSPPKRASKGHSRRGVHLAFLGRPCDRCRKKQVACEWQAENAGCKLCKGLRQACKFDRVNVRKREERRLQILARGGDPETELPANFGRDSDGSDVEVKVDVDADAGVDLDDAEASSSSSGDRTCVGGDPPPEVIDVDAVIPPASRASTSPEIVGSASVGASAPRRLFRRSRDQPEPLFLPSSGERTPAATSDEDDGGENAEDDAGKSAEDKKGKKGTDRKGKGKARAVSESSGGHTPPPSADVERMFLDDLDSAVALSRASTLAARMLPPAAGSGSTSAPVAGPSSVAPPIPIAGSVPVMGMVVLREPGVRRSREMIDADILATGQWRISLASTLRQYMYQAEEINARYDALLREREEFGD
ncbi:hypothetical protein BD779DRAFT_1680464 [Infundibulicybe gibba]|nr:hypothetical protein BD779DRAFT_1680464 [Infundibulicybe gibba]